ncbi:MAG: XRE family transcriptional regulator [Sphingomonadaceae bacterium]
MKPPEPMIRRLRQLVAQAGSQVEVAGRAGMPRATLQSILKGDSDPGFTRIARLADALGVSLDQLAFGEDGADRHDGPSPGDIALVPYWDLAISAGDGRDLFEGPPAKWMPFRRDFISRRFGGAERLAMLRVEGDSMEPELRGGDVVMIDRAQREPREGLFAVRLGDQAMIKRLRLTGPARIELVSANPIYPPIPVDLAAEADGFRCLSRAVWIGRRL